MNRVGLPAAAVTLIARIEALLAEADALLAHATVADEVTYSLRETGRRYLPDTISSYLDIPRSQQDAAAEEMLIGQLTLLERATAQRLATLTEAFREKQSANGAFLAQKFGAVDALPAVPANVPVGDAPPQTLVTRLFSELDAGLSVEPVRVMEMMAERMTAALPKLVTVARGMFGGQPKSVSIDVPVGDHVMRYALRSERSGVEGTCAKIVRGVSLKTERLGIDEWLGGLLEDLTEFVARDRSGRDALDKFLRR